ncbi:MAG: hypothetical protein OXC28_24340 [Defluviicoccus sp.]|nr:hypothetical protein [Defluviicoccus sp.]
MGKRPPKPPPVPDPAKLIEAQAEANRITQFTPQGNLVYGQVTDDGQFAFDPAASRNATMVVETPYQQDFRARQEAIGRTLAGQALDRARGLQFGRLDTAGLPPGFDAAGLEALRGRAERAAYSRAMQLLDPELERQESRLRQSLANRGLPIAAGSAGGDEYGRLVDAGNRARQDAAWAAVAQGGAEADRVFNRRSTARQQGFAERAALRQQQFNELAALLGGQQVAPVGLPRFARAAPPDVLGANALAQQAGLNRYNAQLGQWNQLRQGLGQALGAATLFFPSSRAVKTGNRPADHADSLARLRGLDVERWRYRGDPTPHIGPYAEDFAAAFAGDGRTIDAMDAIGATMSAVKGLAARVDALAERLDETA